MQKSALVLEADFLNVFVTYLKSYHLFQFNQSYGNRCRPERTQSLDNEETKMPSKFSNCICWQKWIALGVYDFDYWNDFIDCNFDGGTALV